MKRTGYLSISIASVIALVANIVFSQQVADRPAILVNEGSDQKKATQVTENIYLAIGFGNTFMVTTPEGNVIIDTSSANNAARHKQLLQAENQGPIKYIVLTHGHGDHTGGVQAWKQPGTQIVAQASHVDFFHYQARLAGFYAKRNAAQFGLATAPNRGWLGNYAGRIEPTVLFTDKHHFEIGGTRFELIHTPGETDDHLTVWIPKYKAAFIGDNFYLSFPNIYTLRGTPQRRALDYINSINKVLALKPEIVLPSHGIPIKGYAEITRQLEKSRNAIQYVHDETVKGMNAGKDVYTLMQEIKLPPELEVGESYGKVTWSIRGIYEGYVGWFDLDPATMYEVPESAVYADLVKLAGGPDRVVKLANERIRADKPVEALHLTEMALEANPAHRAALEARLIALEILLGRCKNTNERGWLEYSIREVKAKLK